MAARGGLGSVMKAAAAKKKEVTEEELRTKVTEVLESKKERIVLIKADDKARYNNLVDILDEMLVCNVGRYAIVDLTDSEKELIKNTQ